MQASELGQASAVANAPQPPPKGSSTKKRKGGADSRTSQQLLPSSLPQAKLAAAALAQLHSLLRLCRGLPLACLTTPQLRRLFTSSLALTALLVQQTQRSAVAAQLAPSFPPDSGDGSGDPTRNGVDDAVVLSATVSGTCCSLVSELQTLLLSRSSDPQQRQQKAAKKGVSATDSTAEGPMELKVTAETLSWAVSVGKHMGSMLGATTGPVDMERISAAVEAAASLLRALSASALSAAASAGAADDGGGGGGVSSCIALAQELVAGVSTCTPDAGGACEPPPMQAYTSSCMLSALTAEMATAAAALERAKRREGGGGGAASLRSALEGLGATAAELALRPASATTASGLPGLLLRQATGCLLAVCGHASAAPPRPQGGGASEGKEGVGGAEEGGDDVEMDPQEDEEEALHDLGEEGEGEVTAAGGAEAADVIDSAILGPAHRLVLQGRAILLQPSEKAGASLRGGDSEAETRLLVRVVSHLAAVCAAAPVACGGVAAAAAATAEKGRGKTHPTSASAPLPLPFHPPPTLSPSPYPFTLPPPFHSPKLASLHLTQPTS